MPQDGQRLVTVTGANMSLRRTTLESVGGFDARFRLAADDTDLCLRLNELRPRARLLYTSRAVVAHDYAPEMRDAFRRSRTYGQAAAFAYLLGRRRLPALFPFPFLIGVTIPLAAVDPVMLAIPVALLLLLYPGWARVAATRRNPAYLGYTLLQAALELWTTVGSVDYLMREGRRS
jgi:GT2 family glycosyltransferase